jgi:thiol-disulfide isomerase/thioredoxin
MAHPDRNFLIRRRLLLAAAPAFFALPALADVGPALLKGSVAQFRLEASPRALPDFAFTDGEDKPLTLGGFKGRTVLMNFWATWCNPCVKEMPSLDRLQAAMDREKFVVLPLSLDGPSRPRVKPFYEDRKLEHLGIYFDKGRKSMKAFDVGILPTSILVDAHGRALGRLEGEADWSTPEALALMKAAVAAGA